MPILTWYHVKVTPGDRAVGIGFCPLLSDLGDSMASDRREHETTYK